MIGASRRPSQAAREPRYAYVGPAEAVTVCPLRGRRDYEGPCGDGSCPGMIRGRCMFVSGEPVRAAEGMFVEARCRMGRERGVGPGGLPGLLREKGGAREW
jgi:hypothetical protein